MSQSSLVYNIIYVVHEVVNSKLINRSNLILFKAILCAYIFFIIIASSTLARLMLISGKSGSTIRIKLVKCLSISSYDWQIQAWYICNPGGHWGGHINVLSCKDYYIVILIEA